MPGKVDNSVVGRVDHVVRAEVIVAEKSVPAVIDAACRIDAFLGIWSAIEWGHSGCGWWSYVTHGTHGTVLGTFNEAGLRQAAAGLVGLLPEVRQHVQAALRWMHEPKATRAQSFRPDVLRVYAGYWNAFECLVEAVNILRPRPKLSSAQKQSEIDATLARYNGKVSVEFVQRAYQDIVNPGLVGKASHGLHVCMPDYADQYIAECFTLSVRKSRLYDIRNAINHGDIDAPNPLELKRIDSRLMELQFIVARMLGRLIPYSCPSEWRQPSAPQQST